MFTDAKQKLGGKELDIFVVSGACLHTSHISGLGSGICGCTRYPIGHCALLQVNSFGSGAQAIAVFLLLPGLAALRGINPGQLPQYLSEGSTHPKSQ